MQEKKGLQPSITSYRKWGKVTHIKLRFSKSGAPNIEKNYATHYIDKYRIAKLKKEKEEQNQEIE